MNPFRMFFIQTSTLRSSSMLQALTKHGRCCVQHKQLPTKKFHWVNWWIYCFCWSHHQHERSCTLLPTWQLTANGKGLAVHLISLKLQTPEIVANIPKIALADILLFLPESISIIYALKCMPIVRVESWQRHKKDPPHAGVWLSTIVKDDRSRNLVLFGQDFNFLFPTRVPFGTKRRYTLLEGQATLTEDL